MQLLGLFVGNMQWIVNWRGWEYSTAGSYLVVGRRVYSVGRSSSPGLSTPSHRHHASRHSRGLPGPEGNSLRTQPIGWLGVTWDGIVTQQKGVFPWSAAAAPRGLPHNREGYGTGWAGLGCTYTRLWARLAGDSPLNEAAAPAATPSNLSAFSSLAR